MTELTQWRANDIVKVLKTEKVSPHNLLDAMEARIGKIDTQVNALPILCFVRARREADRIMKRPVNERGMLCGTRELLYGGSSGRRRGDCLCQIKHTGIWGRRQHL